MEKWLAVITSIVVAIVYLTGYAYLDGFYKYFNISLQELELDVQTILVHAAQPYRSFAASVPLSPIILATVLVMLTIVAIFGADTFLGWIRHFLARLQTTAFWVSVSVILLILSSYVFSGAQELGLRNAKNEYLNLNRMVLLGTPENFEINQFLARVPNTKLYHLVTNETTYFGVIKFSGERRRWVIRVPKSDSIAARVYQDMID